MIDTVELKYLQHHVPYFYTSACIHIAHTLLGHPQCTQELKIVYWVVVQIHNRYILYQWRCTYVRRSAQVIF